MGVIEEAKAAQEVDKEIKDNLTTKAVTGVIPTDKLGTAIGADMAVTSHVVITARRLGTTTVALTKEITPAVAILIAVGTTTTPVGKVEVAVATVTTGVVTEVVATATQISL